MLISKRRFKWGFLLFLVAATMLLVRPVRSWVDRAIAGQFDPDLRVDRIVVHRDQSVVEAKQVLWSKFGQERAFGLSADRAWFAIEGESLVDRQLVVPHAELENTLLFFNDYRPTPEITDNAWHTELAKHIDQVDWNGLEEQYIDLLAPQKTSATWREQIDHWITRSMELRDEATRLASEFRSGDNPLRFEEELREKLEAIDRLAAEHGQLLEQLERVPTAVRIECEKIQQRLSLQTRKLSTAALDAKAVRDSQRVIAESIILQIARANWERLADCGQISDLVATHLPHTRRPNHDRDIAIADETSPVVNVSELIANGTFAHRDARTPFSLSASFGIDEHQTDSLSGEWSYAFRENDAIVGVEIAKQAAVESLSIEMRMLSTEKPLDTSPSDVTVASTGDEYVRLPANWKSTDNYLARLTATATGGVLAGELELTTAGAAGQSEECVRIIDKAMTVSPNGRLAFRVQVSGKWQQPQFTLQEELPSWLLHSIETEVTEHLVEFNSEEDAKLRNELSRQIASLQSIIQIATDAGRARVAGHGEQLNTAKQSLRRSLDSLTGASFSARNQDSQLPR